MKDKEMKHLSRANLLEMLIENGEKLEEVEAKLAEAEKRIAEQEEMIQKNTDYIAELDDYRMQTEMLQEKVKAAEEKLNNREIDLLESGSIAEASLKINDVFLAAQKAADQYLENVKTQTTKTDIICNAREAESRAKADQMIAEAKRECALMKSKAKIEADGYWNETSKRLKEMVEANTYLQSVFQFMNTGERNETEQ